MAKSTFDSNNSAYEKYLENTFLNVPRSRHDLSHVHTGQTTFGILAPVLCLETMPNEDIDLNLTASIQLRNPTPRPLINGCRVYFHAYYNRCRDLWEGFENFVTHGRRQDVQLSKPKLRFVGSYASSDPDGFQTSLNYGSPLSLMDFMGVPAVVRQTAWRSRSGSIAVGLDSFRGGLYLKSGDNLLGTTQNEISPDNLWIDALPFVAYQRNWRDFYSPKNLLMNNKQWFPDNENEFLLPYECERAAFLSHDSPDFVAGSDRARFFGLASDSSESDVLDVVSYWFGGSVPADYLTPDVFAPSSSESSVDYPVLAALKFRCFSGDRFTSGSPFVDLVRGSIPSLSSYVASSSRFGANVPLRVLDGSYPLASLGANHDGGDYYLNSIVGLSDFPNLGIRQSELLNVTQNDLRKLETITVLRERLARTDGDYSDMIGALFGERPSKESHEGIYIGGCYQDVVFSSVTQTSQSTDDSQLGDKAGQGYSVSNGRIGHFHSDDYGWIQVYMSIVPETYYTQGLDAQFSRDVPDKLWNPLMSNMPPQAVLNREVFLSGDPSVDELPFSYEQRGNEYRSRRNRVSGFSALSHIVAAYDSSIVMSRRFISSPSFNSKFLYMTPENIDMDVFSFNDEPPFDFSIGFDLSAVLPMPSVSVPGAMSSDLHA